MYWLIDPIDGTASYCGGFDGYVTQIALIDGYRPLLSAIYAPRLQTFYSAIQGYGAFKDHNPITLARTTSASTIIDNYPEPQGYAKPLSPPLKFQTISNVAVLV